MSGIKDPEWTTEMITEMLVMSLAALDGLLQIDVDDFADTLHGRRGACVLREMQTIFEAVKSKQAEYQASAHFGPDVAGQLATVSKLLIVKDANSGNSWIFANPAPSLHVRLGDTVVDGIVTIHIPEEGPCRILGSGHDIWKVKLEGVAIMNGIKSDKLSLLLLDDVSKGSTVRMCRDHLISGNWTLFRDFCAKQEFSPVLPDDEKQPAKEQPHVLSNPSEEHRITERIMDILDQEDPIVDELILMTGDGETCGTMCLSAILVLSIEGDEDSQKVIKYCVSDGLPGIRGSSADFYSFYKAVAHFGSVTKRKH